MILNQVSQTLQGMIERGQRRMMYIRTRSKGKVILNAPVHQTILTAMRRGAQRKMINIERSDTILNPVQITRTMMGRGPVRVTIMGRREVIPTPVHWTNQSLIGIMEVNTISTTTIIVIPISTGAPMLTLPKPYR